MKHTLAAILILSTIMSINCNAEELKLDFDGNTGIWSGIYVNGRIITVQSIPDVEIHTDNGSLPAFNEWKLVAVDEDGEKVIVVRNAGEWTIRTETKLSGDSIFRKASFKWNGKGPVKVVGTALRTPIFRLSESFDDSYVIPGNFPVTRRKFSDLVAGSVSTESGWTRGDYCVSYIHSPEAKLLVIAGYIFDIDQARMSVEEHKDGVSIIHRLDTLAVMKPGDEIDCGTQVIRIVRGDEKKTLDALNDFCDRLYNGPPMDQPEHLKKCVIYEAHPWGRLESWYSGDRGMRYPRLNSLLPYYKDLGITTVWLLPVSWPPPWVYTLPAFDRIDPGNGTPEELKSFVDKAHKLDMKVLIDLVVYGIKPDSEEVKRHPDEVWCHDENGKRMDVWNGTVAAADCSNPLWQKRISEVVTHWAKDFGFDGTRMDCIGWGQTVNWKNPMRANAPVAYGGLQLNKVVRDSMRTVNPDAVTLPEGGKPLVFRNADMLFDYPFYLAMRDMTTAPDLAAWIKDLQEWLEYERLCYPKRAVKGLVRFLECHDTVSAAQYFGVGPSQALMAVCSLIQGTPLIHQEQEIGFSKDLAKWLKLRNSEKCFYDGTADYLSVKCTNPNVFCFIRRCGSEAAVVAVNFTGSDVKCRLTWPDEFSAKFPYVFDAFTGDRIKYSANKAEVSIPAYRPVVLLLKPEADYSPALESDDAGTPALWKVESLEDGRITVTGAESWFIRTAEGSLEDDFRSYFTKAKPGETLVDALPVLKRAWNPLPGGLLDGAKRATLGVKSIDGRSLLIQVDPAKATDVRIVDAALNGERVELVVSPKDCFTIQEEGPREDRVVATRSDRLRVTPQFVHLRAGKSTMTISRRHGGVPVSWISAGSPGSLVGTSDAYTDYGIYPKGQYASVDGETNPRMEVRESKESTEVTFTGRLHGRAWNGVQTCPLLSPQVDYRLSYKVDSSARLTVTIGIKPSVDLPKTNAFLALRVPLKRFEGWKCGAKSGKAGERKNDRLVSSSDLAAGPLYIKVNGHALAVSGFDGLQNVFLAEDGGGNGQLFFALLDGVERDLKAGEAINGSVVIELTGDLKEDYTTFGVSNS